jgi:fibronectin type 3 domain-containing protein
MAMQRRSAFRTSAGIWLGLGVLLVAASVASAFHIVRVEGDADQTRTFCVVADCTEQCNDAGHIQAWADVYEGFSGIAARLYDRIEDGWFQAGVCGAIAAWFQEDIEEDVCQDAGSESVIVCTETDDYPEWEDDTATMTLEPDGTTSYLKTTTWNCHDENGLPAVCSLKWTADGLLERWVITEPSVPRNFTATPSCLQVALDWDAPEDDGGDPDISYGITRDDIDGQGEPMYASTAQTWFTDTNVTDGSTHNYSIYAFTDGHSNRTGLKAATLSCAPGAPTAFAAAAGPGVGEIQLSWQPPSETGASPVDGYKVYRANATNDPYELVATLSDMAIFTDSGLPTGATRFYKINATNANGEGLQSASASASTFDVPGAPTGLSASRGDGQVTLTWTAPTNDGGAPLTGYALYRGTSSGTTSFLANLGTGTSHTDTGLTNGATYYYQVAAKNLAGEGPHSNEANATPAALPGAPPALTATRGNAQVSLAWDVPANGGSAILNYTLYRGTTSGSETFHKLLGNVTSHTDTGLTNGVTYHYKVSANNTAGEGPQSNEASATPGTVPSAPLSLAVARGPAVGELQLDWQAPTNNGGLTIINYKVYRATSSGGTYGAVATLGNVLTYTDTGLPNGATRWYKISAVNDAGEGAQSSSASGTTFDVPSAPTGISASVGPGAGELKLTWNAPSSDGGLAITNYKLYRATSNGGTYSLTATLGSVLTYTDTGLPNGATRWYKVSATNAAGEGAQSSSASATTFDVPGAPASLTATAGPGIGEIKLTWQAPSTNGGAAITDYKLYRATTSGGTYSLAATLGNVLTFTDTALGHGATRYYKVSAANLVGDSAQSSSASGTTFDLPSEPRNLAATSGPGAGEISLSWQAPTSNGGTAITGYKIYRATTSGGPYSAIASLGSVLSYKDTGLPSSATRYYKVSAGNLVGEGPQSTEASATSPAIVPPSAPLNLAATPGPGAGQIKLTWQAPAQDGGAPVTSYGVYRAESSSGPYTKITTVGSVLTHTDAGLPNGATRWYKIAAINQAGEGAPSTSASARTFDKPTAPRNVDTEATLGFHVTLDHIGLAIKLSWDAPTDDGGTPITGYKVYWTTDPNQLGQLVATVGNVHDWTHTDADLTKPNYYRITALNLVGEGPGSPRACALTYPWAAAPLIAPPGGACAG